MYIYIYIFIFLFLFIFILILILILIFIFIFVVVENPVRQCNVLKARLEFILSYYVILMFVAAAGSTFERC